jgi:hypothetical protein
MVAEGKGDTGWGTENESHKYICSHQVAPAEKGTPASAQALLFALLRIYLHILLSFLSFWWGSFIF